jgi:hypothetical protein
MVKKWTEEVEFIKKVLQLLANDIKVKWKNKDKSNFTLHKEWRWSSRFLPIYKSHWTNWLYVPIVKTLPCSSCTVLDGSGVESRWWWDFPASCTMGTGSFSGVKRPRRSFNHRPHLAPRLQKLELYFCSHSAPSWQVTFTLLSFYLLPHKRLASHFEL